MREPKWYDFISDWINDVEWYFAKRWLNKTFGYKEYWGDYIQQCLWSDQAKNNPDHPDLDQDVSK